MSPLPIDVLLVEDNPDDAFLVRNALMRKGPATFSITHAVSLTEALGFLNREHFAVMLADLGLRDSDSVHTVLALVAAAPQTPVIVLTAVDDDEAEEATIQAGAQDYLVKGETGGPLLARAIFHAIERKRLDLELKRSNEELLTANRELEAFGLSISHDLRAPIRAIDGFSKMFAEDCGAELSAQGQEYLRLINDAAHRMSDMVTALARLCRLDGEMGERRPIDMDSLASECLRDQAAEIGKRGVQIELQPLPGCTADRALLKQAVDNLLSNALKYSRGRAPAKIAIGSETLGGETAYFVRDNGVGFDMNHAGKLFGVFQRLHRPDEFEGSGIGLAIVRRIVRYHGGRVWAESAPGAGATFRFTVPQNGREKA